MKRTLLITLDFPPQGGGVANYWKNLCRFLNSDDLVVLTSEHEASLEFDQNEKYLIYRKDLFYQAKWIYPKWLKLLSETIHLVKQEEVKQIVVTHILPCGTVAYIIKKFFNIPYFVSLHGLDAAYAAKSWRKRFLSRLILKNSQGIIVNSQYTKQLVGQNFKLKCDDKITIVYPCPNIDYEEIDEESLNIFKKEFRLENKKILLTVARLVKRKGHDYVIKALKQAIETIPNLVYLVVGKGVEESNLKDLVAGEGLIDKVLFFNDIQNSELPYFYSACDAFIMPSRLMSDGDVEGFGIVYLEANSFGKPAIAGRSGGIPEAVEHARSGLLIDPNSVEEISRAIVSLLNDQDVARQMGEYASCRVIEQFNWTRQASKLINILS